jgi:beta-lactamase class A
MKLPILLAYLKRAESDPGILEKKIIYTKDPEYEDYIQNFKPTKKLEVGTEYSFRDLLVYMIKYSSNEASVLLEKNIDIQYIVNTFSDL